MRAGERTVSVPLMPIAAYIDWAGDLGMASLPARDGLRFTLERGVFWWEDLPGGIVYVRYAQVAPAPSADLAAMAERARAPDVRRVILDLRQNPGGDNHNNPALLRVFADPTIDIAGRLTVLTDRLTFSAAANLATQLEQATKRALRRGADGRRPELLGRRAVRAAAALADPDAGRHLEPLLAAELGRRSAPLDRAGRRRPAHRRRLGVRP